MPHLLKNQNLELHIDLPGENYRFPRFDWTGKIASLKYQDRLVSGVERTDGAGTESLGKGFYNEFGIDAPVGYEEVKTGDWFHKIGVGLLQKEAGPYRFDKDYEVQPAGFSVRKEADKLLISCKSALHNGYGYVLHKEIALLESGFRINYQLQNTGTKTIRTNEYNHNFLAIDQDLMGRDYVLKFPFVMKPERFGESVNPEQKVEIRQQEVKFNGNPQTPFFFSNLSGGEKVEAKWELIHLKSKIGISETGSFPTDKVNLWGWGHVISPELFFSISIEAGQSTTWSRTYEVFELNGNGPFSFPKGSGG